MLKSRHLHFLLLLILGLAIYSNALWGQFVYDDELYILTNPLIRDLSNFLDLSGTRYVAFLSFAMNYAVGGYNVFGYNLTNIIIHIINSMLVYSLVSLILKTPGMKGIQIETKHLALLASLLFLTHPIETQAVNYIVQRFATLATLFYLSSVTLYLKARLTTETNGSGKPGARYFYYGAALAAAVLAQKTKAISFTLPFMIVLFEFTFFSLSEGIQKKAKRLVPFLFTLAIIPASILLGASKVALKTESSTELVTRMQMELLTEYSRYDYLLIQFRVVVSYLRLLVFPMNQNLLHETSTYDSFFAPGVIASFAFLAALFFLSAFLWFRSKKRRDALGLLIATGVLWFFITISIESSIIPLRYKMFEHRLYLPSVGFFITATAIFFYIARALSGARSSKTKTGAKTLAIAAVIILALSTLTYKRNTVWSTELSLWKDVISKNPDAPGAHFKLGAAYSAEKNAKMAVFHYRESIRLDSGNIEPYNNLGNILLVQGKLDEALKEFRKALKLDPDFDKTRNNLANALTRLGRYDEAKAQYRAALKLNPSNTNTLINIGINYTLQGRFKEAIENFEHAIEINPNDSYAFYNYALALTGLKRIDEAENAYLTAIELNPKDVGSRNNLANIHMRKNNLTRALALYEEVVKLNPSHARALNNLGIIMNITGRNNESLAYYKRAIKTEPAYADAHYNMGITLEDLGKYNEAAERYKEVLKLVPKHAGARKNLESILLNDGADVL
ncbi:MAG: tetratricopeptide repeat protein [Thermodesulfobacteriota bacterium]